jgi:hypothetical protein
VADDGGSVWWRQVNGLLLLDMVDAAALGTDDVAGCSEPVRAWTRYWSDAHSGHGTRSCWDAHQASLAAGVGAAQELLGAEPPSEQDFIAIALSSVELASRANLPTGRAGASVIGGFCRVFYPDGYPAAEGAAGHAESMLERATGRRHPGRHVVAGVLRHGIAGDRYGRSVWPP